METNEMLENIAAILAGITRSRLFWDVQQSVRGERILLSYLYETGGACTPGRLADLLHVSAARITKILSTLESKDLVAREADQADKRRVAVRLTPAGARVVTDVHAQVLSHASQLFRNLGEHDTEEFLRIVNKILSLEEMVDAVPTV